MNRELERIEKIERIVRWKVRISLTAKSNPKILSFSFSFTPSLSLAQLSSSTWSNLTLLPPTTLTHSLTLCCCWGL